MRRRSYVVGAVCVVGLAVGGVAVAASDEPDPGPPPAQSGDADERSYATVEQRDIVRSEELDGVVGHGAARALRLTGEGTITRLPAVDDVIEFGQQIAEVNGEPVVLLPGDRPAWRVLGAGISKGEDIRQLEAALVILGFADPEQVTIDDTWAPATTAAVKVMQKWLGMPDDGRLELGEIVFEHDVARVSAVSGNLGDAASAAGIEVTGLEQAVTMSVVASKVDLVDIGKTVSIELPSGETFTGEVTAVGQPVVADDGGVTYPVTIATEPIDVGDGVPVVITVDVVAVENAIAVPAEALLALAEGGYAVEVPDSSSPSGTRLVPVEVGSFADGWVEVTGDIAPGDGVAVP